MTDVQTLRARDVVSSKLAHCYMTQGSNRYLLMNAIKLEAKAEKNKQEVAILGRTSKGHKTSSVNYTGSMTVYYVTNLFLEQMKTLQETGEDIYFDIQATIEDPTSDAGKLTIILKDCNIDSTTLISFDADSDGWVEQEMDFTFESYEVVEKFNELDGISQ